MFFLAFERHGSKIYVGSDGTSLIPLNSHPLFLPTRYNKNNQEILPIAGVDKYPGRLFLEDYFDPVTRIRRGRIYRLQHVSQPNPLIFSEDTNVGQNDPYFFTYQRESIHALDEFKGSKLPTVILGGEEHFTRWEIVSIEQDSNETFLFTLKTYRSFGEVPNLKLSAVPEDIRDRLIERIDHLEDSINRGSPHNVVDRCRDVLSLIFGYLCGNLKKDLDDAIKAYTKLPEGQDKKLVQHAAHTARMLHSRGKPNFEEKFETPPLSEADAQLAVRSLGLVLRDLGWAG